MGLNVDKLNWKRVEEDGFDEIEGGFDDGTFYGLEEIDDVAVVKEDRTVKFVPKEDKKNKKEKSSTKDVQPQKNGTSVNSSKANTKKKKKSEPKKDKTADMDDSSSIEDDNVFSALSKETTIEPAYSLGSWPSGLDWRIYTGLKNLEFLSPTPIQTQSIPSILEGKDVIGKAATGSGKTLAYSIPLLQRFYLNPEKSDLRPEGLIVSPTRELAHQIRDHLKNLIFPEYRHRIVALTGGLAIQKQLRQLSKSPTIVVATPGRLFEILEQMPAKKQDAWKEIPALVLDEADRLVQSGSFAELGSALKIIGITQKRQVLVYSATFNTQLWASLGASKKRKRSSNDILEVMQKQIGLSDNAIFVDADPESQVANSVIQAVIECPNMEKDLYLYYFLLLYPGKTVVFVNSIDAVKRITPLLKELQVKAVGVHSDMIQKQRLRSIERFKEMENSVLIATDVAARGLDVPLVTHVVHYHLPRTGDMYVHRSGRTARAGNKGVSVVLCSPQEASGPLPNLVKLIHTKPLHIDIDYDVLERLRDRVRLAKKIADTQSMAMKKGKSESWMAHAAEELGIDIDDDFNDVFGGDLKRAHKGKDQAALPGESSSAYNLRIMRSELTEMMKQKLRANRRYLTSGTQNLAHEMLKRPNSVVPGKPFKSALEELQAKQKPKPSDKPNASVDKPSTTEAPAPPTKKKKKGAKVKMSNVTSV